MRSLAILCLVLLAAAVPGIEAAEPPALEAVRKAMGIPSEGARRGQQDAVGFASTAPQMDEVVRLSAGGPAPEVLGEAPRGPVLGAVCPHDDYVYAGRMVRAVLAPVTAKTVVILGVFHKWRAFGFRDRLIFDPYQAWRSPDGDVPVSPLREAVMGGLSRDDFVVDAAMQDAEHSVEPIVYWLRRQNPQVEILPVLVPTMAFDRMEALAGRFAASLKAAMDARGLVLGRDVMVVASSDAVHYGPDFDYTPFGEGGPEAYVKACAQDRRLLKEYLDGPVTRRKAKGLTGKLVDPTEPGRYRIPWCGRFSVPFTLLVLEDLEGKGRARATPVAYATSVGWPELAVTDGPRKTAPANLYHFVGYPGVVFTRAGGR